MVAQNRRAWHEFEILERFEAGLVLRGTEIKSIREGKVSISEAYARIRGGEAFVFNMDISPYSHASLLLNHAPKRVRKLLLHKRELKKLVGKTEHRGLTLIPLALVLREGWAKLELGLARGKKLYDKRQAMRRRESERDLRRRTLRY